jgi:hypothetical protein
MIQYIHGTICLVREKKDMEDTPFYLIKLLTTHWIYLGCLLTNDLYELKIFIFGGFSIIMAPYFKKYKEHLCTIFVTSSF